MPLDLGDSVDTYDDGDSDGGNNGGGICRYACGLRLAKFCQQLCLSTAITTLPPSLKGIQYFFFSFM
jgi:hypothetical protein